MLFWLQKELNNKIDIDTTILQEELDKQKFNHLYDIGTIKDYECILNTDMIEKENLEKVIPVGSLNFVQMILSRIHNVNHMNPIEVPDVLREDRFLKRKYSIVPKKQLPNKGYYFTKYVSKLKVFSHTGIIETLQYTDDGKEPFLKEGLYQVSEVVDILSEYRCFVQNDKLVAMNYYDGDCTVFPDVSEIKSMIGNYMRDQYRPKAYTMDIAVIRDRGTAILDVHPWVSVGLYGYMFGSLLPYCYRDGFEYYINSNKEIREWSNF